ncbi:MAG: hypothetical protein ACK55I_22820, partial [bacterium]
ERRGRGGIGEVDGPLELAFPAGGDVRGLDFKGARLARAERRAARRVPLTEAQMVGQARGREQAGEGLLGRTGPGGGLAGVPGSGSGRSRRAGGRGAVRGGGRPLDHHVPERE